MMEKGESILGETGEELVLKLYRDEISRGMMYTSSSTLIPSPRGKSKLT